MKKLNNKGFTLVELLAVIIILAIVVGISIPAVMTTTNNAKKKAFQTAAETAADWIDRQYEVVSTGLNLSTGGVDAIATADPNFTDKCGNDGSKCTYTTASAGVQASDALVAAAGLKTTNILKMQIIINKTTGRSCVKLTAKDSGDYYTSSSATTVTAGACGLTFSS